MYIWAYKSTSRILFGDAGALLLQLQCSGMKILYKELKAKNH